MPLLILQILLHPSLKLVLLVITLHGYQTLPQLPIVFLNSTLDQLSLMKMPLVQVLPLDSLTVKDLESVDLIQLGLLPQLELDFTEMPIVLLIIPLVILTLLLTGVLVLLLPQILNV